MFREEEKKILSYLYICLVSGSKMSISLPIIASNPHFLDADRSVQNSVVGLIPNELIHRSYVDIEPITGSKILIIYIIKLELILFFDY